MTLSQIFDHFQLNEFNLNEAGTDDNGVAWESAFDGGVQRRCFMLTEELANKLEADTKGEIDNLGWKSNGMRTGQKSGQEYEMFVIFQTKPAKRTLKRAA